MESTKKIKIQDLENTFYFQIQLFDAERGLDFLDNIAGRLKGGLSIKPYIDDLLPLASMLDSNGEKIVQETVTRKDCYSIFQNPLSIINLCIEIFKFQEVFLKDSEIFLQLKNNLGSIWNTKISGSVTSSEMS